MLFPFGTLDFQMSSFSADGIDFITWEINIDLFLLIILKII